MNSSVTTLGGATSAPTPFAELNELLGELVARVAAILGDNFVGAYLTGSFALGAADLHSDCDFLVVTEDRLTAAQERALRELHGEVPARPGHWTHHLEGSYAPRAELATLASLDERWLYIDHGWREMQWSTHCNTEHTRWALREHGITLAGPAPREFVDEVPADALRHRMRQLIENFLPDLFSWTSFDLAWSQRYAVASLCRMLYTLETAEVASKRAALEWARDELSPAWRDLIQQALDERALGWNPDDGPSRADVQAALAFADYARERRYGRWCSGRLRSVKLRLRRRRISGHRRRPLGCMTSEVQERRGGEVVAAQAAQESSRIARARGVEVRRVPSRASGSRSPRSR